MRAIAWYTGKEFLRKKIAYIVLFIAFLLLLWSIIAGQLALSEQVKIVQDMGLNIIEICGLIMTLFFWSYLLSNEISQGTIFLLLSKNIKRSNIIIGKYIGFAFVLFVLRLLLSFAFWWVTNLYNIARSNIYFLVLLGIFLSWLLTLAVVMFFSTFVSPFVALFTSIIIYLLGHMMSFVVYYVNVLKQDAFGPMFTWFIKGIYLVVPNYTSLSLQEFLNFPSINAFAAQHFLGAAVTTIVYIVILLTLGAVIFRKKEL